jgi:hypothetical protein
MKFTLEQFDFANLKPDSILMVEFDAPTKANAESAQKVIAAMKQTGKVPKETLCLLTCKQNPIKIRELPEDVMNRNGWIKVKLQVNGHTLRATDVKEITE